MTEERVTWGHTNDEGRCTADIAMDLHTILRTSGKGYYIALSGVRMEVFPRTRCPVGVCARSHLLLQYHSLAYLRPSSQHSRPLGMPEWRELSGTLTLVMKVTVSRMRCSASAAVEWTTRRSSWQGSQADGVCLHHARMLFRGHMPASSIP